MRSRHFVSPYGFDYGLRPSLRMTHYYRLFCKLNIKRTVVDAGPYNVSKATSETVGPYNSGGPRPSPTATPSPRPKKTEAARSRCGFVSQKFAGQTWVLTTAPGLSFIALAPLRYPALRVQTFGFVGCPCFLSTA